MNTTRLLALAVLVVAILAWPALFGSAIANLAGASLLKLPPCDPESAACQPEARPYPPEAWAGNRPQLEALRGRLAWAVNLAPRVQSLRLRLGETLLAFGQRAQAAAYLPTADPTLRMYNYVGVEIGIPPARPRLMSLLSKGPFDNYLIAGYQQSAAGNWETAVYAFRLALSHGAAEMSRSDHQAYFNALAHYHAQQAETVGTARSAYLAGKYFARAGEWTAAEQWLQRAQQASDWNELSPDEQARTWIYLGLAREQAGDFPTAQTAYQTAVELTPKLREAHARLLALLRKLPDQPNADRLAGELATLGPKYLLGEFGAGLDNPQPVALPNGRMLVGYDLDEESLEAGGLLDVWLWWQVPSGQTPSVSEWLRAGSYWLQHTEIVNLVPNPGFEWGMDRDDLPLGFISKYSSHTPDGVHILATTGPAGENKVLHLQGVGVKTPLIRVEPQTTYLTAVWLKGAVYTGQQCFSGQPSMHQMFYAPWGEYSKIGQLTTDEAANDWRHVARLDRLDAGMSLCQLFPSSSGEFDRLLFARLPLN